MYARQCTAGEKNELSKTMTNIPQLDGNISITSDYSDSKIPVIVSSRESPVNCVNKVRPLSTIIEDYLKLSNVIHQQPVLNKIRKSDKVASALNLPTVMNLNSRSIYNKINEFHDVVTQYEVDLVFSPKPGKDMI